MKSIKSLGLELKNKKTSMIFKTSLTLALILFAFTTSFPSSFFQIVKPAAAGTLSWPTVIPANNIVNTKTTYDIFFTTVTTGKIQTIHMSFPSGFDVTGASRLIQRSGIGEGLLSAPSSTTLIYTVNNPVTVSAGTTIKLEIGMVINSNTAGNFRVGITTKDTIPTVIDGPTLSWSFRIKDITGKDVSPEFMIRKTLKDDTAGHAHGWNPDASTRAFAISDSDISGASNSEFVSVMIRSGNPAFCAAASGDAGLFGVYCDSPPGNSAELDYIITKLPAHVASSLSASTYESTPSSASPSLSSSPHKPVLPDIESINRQDDIASEFP